MKQFILLNTAMIAISFSAISQSGSSKQTSFVNSRDGIQIAYEVHGTGMPALVFIHGWSCDRSYWKAQIEPFARQYQVITIDLAGHGESGLGRKTWTIQAFGDDVAAVVNKLGLQRVILIGHSMGGDVIMEAAKRLNNRVVGLIMVDTYKKLGPGRTPEQVQAFIKRLRVNFADSTRALVRSLFISTSDSMLVERVAADMSSAPPAVALSALESAFNYSREITHALEELKLPVITINSDNGPTDVRSMEQYGVQVMIMSGVGHFLMMEDPESFNRMLRTAIENIIHKNP